MDRSLLEKICKVRALARNNPEELEASAAESKLAELLGKHSITEADLDRFEGASQPAPAPPPPGVQPFPGGVVIHVVPGAQFGGIFSHFFGGGFGFDVEFGTSTSAGDTTTSGFGP